MAQDALTGGVQKPTGTGSAPRIDPVTGEAVADVTAPPPPLKEEIAALVEDGKIYAEAEFAFQKTRLSFAADRGKSALILGVLAFGFVHLMLIALVVGSIIALAPMVGGWAAMGIVVGVLLLATIIFGLIIRSKIKDVTRAFAKSDP
ncbi:MAG: phage holin family protein [Marinomonas sp.]